MVQGSRGAGVWGGSRDRAQEWVSAGFVGDGGVRGRAGFSSPFPTRHWVARLVLSSKFHKSSLFHLTGSTTNSAATVSATAEAGFWPPNRQVWRQAATGMAMMT